MENVENRVGPILSDRELYQVLDVEKFPKLAECISMLDAGDEQGARALFASVARGVLKRDKFFALPGREAKPEFTNGIKSVAERALRHEMVSCGTPMKFEGKVTGLPTPPSISTRNGPGSFPDTTSLSISPKPTEQPAISVMPTAAPSFSTAG